jgi:rubredoxin
MAKSERYTLLEWVRQEALSYGKYLARMSGDVRLRGWALIEEYHRQGGEDVVYVDEGTGEIVVNNQCPNCQGRRVGHTKFSGGLIRSSDMWCPACGFGYSEDMGPRGAGAGGEYQLSAEELAQKQKDRRLRIALDGLHWRAVAESKASSV